MKKIIFLFIFIFLSGCLSVKQENCGVMLDGEVKDECFTMLIVQDYLETKDLGIGIKCKESITLDSSSILCYKSLAITAAYNKDNFHAVSFCEETFNINAKDKYGNMIDCLTEVAIILGDPVICEYAQFRYDETKSFWNSILAPPDRGNIKLDICQKRAELSKKRSERIEDGFY
ncbi:hypothetical protein KO317_00560 [Candidatus Micrarchaeota archaeon]|jgi:hypothetical protein|nr:hypothetical protein [Candidatus Micrarchaeota archaeon]